MEISHSGQTLNIGDTAVEVSGPIRKTLLYDDIVLRTVLISTNTIMPPGAQYPGMSQLYGGSSDGFNSWEAMDEITQDTRANIVADIVGHPKEMPSMKELDYTNPSVNRSTISGHLENLREAGIVGKVEIPVGERSRDLPHVFYYITEDAWEFFDQNNLFDRETWQDQYAKVDKTPEIQRIQEMERPDRD